MRSLFTIAVQSHNFDHRLCWMLSSLWEQTIDSVIIVHLSFLRHGTIERTIDCFNRRPGPVWIQRNGYDSIESLERRGITRNAALRDCSTRYLLFADSDHVYHPEYFQHLLTYVNVNENGFNGIWTAGRMSQQRSTLADMIIGLKTYPQVIDNAYDKCIHLAEIRRANVGAGYFQLINFRSCPHDRIYVSESDCNDWRWSTKYQKAKSDIQFRKRIGLKRKLPRWFSENQIHLNHARDNEHGRHLTEMR